MAAEGFERLTGSVTYNPIEQELVTTVPWSGGASRIALGLDLEGAAALVGSCPVSAEEIGDRNALASLTGRDVTFLSAESVGEDVIGATSADEVRLDTAIDPVEAAHSVAATLRAAGMEADADAFTLVAIGTAAFRDPSIDCIAAITGPGAVEAPTIATDEMTHVAVHVATDAEDEGRLPSILEADLDLYPVIVYGESTHVNAAGEPEKESGYACYGSLRELTDSDTSVLSGCRITGVVDGGTTLRISAESADARDPGFVRIGVRRIDEAMLGEFDTAALESTGEEALEAAARVWAAASPIRATAPAAEETGPAKAEKMPTPSSSRQILEAILGRRRPATERQGATSRTI